MTPEQAIYATTAAAADRLADEVPGAYLHIALAHAHPGYQMPAAFCDELRRRNLMGQSDLRPSREVLETLLDRLHARLSESAPV